MKSAEAMKENQKAVPVPVIHFTVIRNTKEEIRDGWTSIWQKRQIDAGSLV